MEVRFHRRVQDDLNGILEQYWQISATLGDDFFAEFRIGVDRVASNPRFFHFDPGGLRRYNLERFPYHFLYDIRAGTIRIWVVRHHRRNPAFGQRRYPR